jgi:hypothetical protein
VADTRELILARLVAVCGAVEGVAAVARNRLDVAGLARPAVLVGDGIEEMRDAPPGARYGELSRMELTPDITVIARGGTDGGGQLMSLYRSRLLAMVLTDAELIAITGRNGGIRYQGCLAAPPDPEGREYRLDLTLVFSYVFKLGDLGAGAPLALAIRVERPASGATIVLLGGQYTLHVASGPLDALTVRLPPDPPIGGLVEISFATPVADLTVQNAAGETVPTAPTSGYGPGAALQFRYVDATLGWLYWK